MKKIILLLAILFASVFANAQTSTKVGQDTTAKLLRQVRTSLQTGTLNTVSRTTTVSALPSNTTNLATSALQTTQNTNITNLRGDVQNILADMQSGTQYSLLTSLNDLNITGAYKTKAFVTTFSVVPAASCGILASIRSGAFHMNIRKIIITGTQTTSGKIPILIGRGSVNPSGGTSTTVTPVQLSGQATETSASVLKVFTANPTLPPMENIGYFLLPVSSLTDANNSQLIISFYKNELSNSLGSDPTAFNIYINLLGATLTGGVLYMSIYWDE